MSQIITRKQYNSAKTGAMVNRSGAVPKRTALKPKQQQNKQNQAAETDPKKVQSSETWNSDTVYLETSNPEQNTYRHPVEVGATLTSKGIRKIKDIQKIGRFRYKVSFGTAEDASSLALCNLEDTGLKVYIPHISKEIMGLVKGLPVRYSETEIFENLRAEEEVISVERLKRKNSDGKLVETSTVRIKFKGKTLPETAVLYGWRFHPELYIFPMKQCRNCWMFGHKTGVCRKGRKCANCGNDHDTETECREQTRCLNCGRNHRSDDPRCPERRRQNRVNEAAQRKRITQQEARELLLKRDPRHENQFELLGRMEEFPELNDNVEHETSNAWTGRAQWKQTRRTSQDKGAKRRHRNSETAESETSRNKEDIQRDRTEMNRLTRKVEELARSIRVIGSIIRLQKCVEEETRQQQDAVSMEAIIIRINTVLKEMVYEFGKNALEADKHSEIEDNDNSRNGQSN